MKPVRLAALVFDLLLAAYLVSIWEPEPVFTSDSDSPMTVSDQRLIYWLSTLIDGAVVGCLAVAFIALGSKQRQAAFFQRLVFWSLLVRCAFTVLEIGTAEDGLSAILMIMGLIMFLIVTSAAFYFAVHLGEEVKRG